MSIDNEAPASSVTVQSRDTADRWARLRNDLSYRNISAIYLLIIIVVVFGLLVPETFLTPVNAKLILSDTAVTGIVALGLVLPLSAGVFDLSIGGSVGLAGVVCAWLQAVAGWGVLPSVLVALACGVLIGAVNATLVVHFRIDSFIATLGTGSMLVGAVLFITGGQQITGLQEDFGNFARGTFLGIPYSVYYLLVLALVLWYFLDRLPLGRYIYATGGGPAAARLAGVRTNRYVVGTLISSATIAAFAGVVVTSRIGVGSIDIGPKFVLPAFAAAFFGATQFKRGRFNVWGTWLAVIVLGAGIAGLELLQAGFWAADVFNGAVLVVAVGLSVRQRTRPSLRRGRRAAKAA